MIVFVTLTVCGWWVLKTAPGSAWRWATGIGIVLATAQILGLWLRRFDSLFNQLLAPENVAWVVAHWLGIAWLTTCGLAALIWALDTFDLRSTSGRAANRPGRGGLFVRLVASLGGPDPARRRGALLAVMGMLVLSRLPYLVVYWPGILHFDTIRGYSYVRGTVPWDTYDPVGHSLLVGVMQWLGTALGWGDAGGLAIGAVTVILASSAAWSFMLYRMAVWGLHPGVWAATFAWLALQPVFGFFTVALSKDVPYSIAMIVLLVCIGELSFGSPDTARKLWPWATLTLAGIFSLILRNNGIHVMALTLPLLFLTLRHLWKRVLAVTVALGAAYCLYVGPVYAALDVRPGPQEEAFAVPLQQLGRIAKYKSAELSPAEREFMTRTFAGSPPEELGNHYVPYLADPMKLTARKVWGDQSTAEFLAGWIKVAVRHPGTAIEASLANTVGYWDPEGPSYDGITRWSANNARRIHLDIPFGEPTTGLAAWVESSGIMPTKTYGRGLADDGYRAIPVLGQAMSPGPVCWLWYVAALLVIRRRERTALAIFVPAAALLLSFLAGPVSGGQRYTLTLFMALPLAVTAVVLARRTSDERSASSGSMVEPPRPLRSHAAPEVRTGGQLGRASTARPGPVRPSLEDDPSTSALTPTAANGFAHLGRLRSHHAE